MSLTHRKTKSTQRGEKPGGNLNAQSKKERYNDNFRSIRTNEYGVAGDDVDGRHRDEEDDDDDRAHDHQPAEPKK